MIALIQHRNLNLAATLTAFVLFLPLAASAQETPLRTIVVSGTGEASAVPDQAQVSAGVVSQAATADAALDANTDAMEQIFETLRDAGIEERNIRTSNFSVSPQYEAFGITIRIRGGSLPIRSPISSQLSSKTSTN